MYILSKADIDFLKQSTMISLRGRFQSSVSFSASYGYGDDRKKISIQFNYPDVFDWCRKASSCDLDTPAIKRGSECETMIDHIPCIREWVYLLVPGDIMRLQWLIFRSVNGPTQSYADSVVLLSINRVRKDIECCVSRSMIRFE